MVDCIKIYNFVVGWLNGIILPIANNGSYKISLEVSVARYLHYFRSIIDRHLRADDKSPLHIITNPSTTNIKLDVVLG